MQSTIRAQSSGAGESPKRPDAEPKKWLWLKRGSTLGRLARRALGPSVGALGGAAAALLYSHLTPVPPKVIAVRFPVLLAPEAKLNMIAPEASPEEASAALPAPGGSSDPGKAANPAALLALRKAQAAYMIGDTPGALDALGAFDRELSGTRSGAEQCGCGRWWCSGRMGSGRQEGPWVPMSIRDSTSTGPKIVSAGILLTIASAPDR